MSSWLNTTSRPRKFPIINNTIQKTDIKPVSVEKQKVYYVTNMIAGGSYKYIKDLIYHFPETTFIAITNVSELQKYKREFNSNHILLFQYVLFSVITFKNIIDIVLQTGIKLVVPIHDFYFLSPCTTEPNSTIHTAYISGQNVNLEKVQLLKLAKFVIFPSIFVQNEILRFIPLNNHVVTPHIDNKINNINYIPKIENKTINIGIINELSEVKGVEYYKELLKITAYKEYTINYHIFTGDKTFLNYPNIIIYPRYNNDEIIQLLHSNNIHALTFLNKWGETYCYSLTHALRSGLSIIYSNIGAFTERIPNSEHHFPIEPNISSKIVDITTIIQGFHNQLDYLITNNGKLDSRPILENEIIIPDFYKKLLQ
jgi:hypothetical protein